MRYICLPMVHVNDPLHDSWWSDDAKEDVQEGFVSIETE